MDLAKIEQIRHETKSQLDRVYARFMTLPTSNVLFEVSDSVELQRRRQHPDYRDQCPVTQVYLQSGKGSAKGWRHRLGLLNGLPEGHLKAFCAHLYAHAWLFENVPTERKISRASVEGFCDFIAYRLMEAWGNRNEMLYVLNYGRSGGQLQLLLEVDKAYGTYRLLEWIKYGVDDRLQAEDLDRVRRLSSELQSDGAPRKEWSPPPQPRVDVAPDRLVLSGISGTGRRRLALINGTPLSAGESAAVRVGDKKQAVRCLEIREASVVLEVVDSQERMELHLKAVENP
jgi:hypothetical protein